MRLSTQGRKALKTGKVVEGQKHPGQGRKTPGQGRNDHGRAETYHGRAARQGRTALRQGRDKQELQAFTSRQGRAGQGRKPGRAGQ